MTMKTKKVSVTVEEELREVTVEAATPNWWSAKEYRKFQKKIVKGSCDEYEDNKRGYPRWDERAKCRTCGKLYSRHREARYEVFHKEVF